MNGTREAGEDAVNLEIQGLTPVTDPGEEQREVLRNRPLTDVDWLAVLIDEVWLTRELCVVVAVGIDMEGNKRVLDFEQGVSENVTVVSALVERLARGGGGVRSPFASAA